MAIEPISKEQTVTTQPPQKEKVSDTQNEDLQEVSVFSVDDKSIVGKKIQEEADQKLSSISNHIISKSNKTIETVKRVGIFGLGAGLLGLLAKGIIFNGALPSAALTIGVAALAVIAVVGLVECFGGNKKRKAGYTKYASSVKDKDTMDLSKAPGVKSDILEKAGQIIVSSNNPTPLSTSEIAQSAPEALGKQNVHSRGIYIVNSNNDGQRAESILIADGRIDSEKYNGLSTAEGIEKDIYEIPAEYSDFVKKYLGTNNKITKKQADKLIQIIKAMETDGIYSKTQSENNDGRKEDIEIFDLSGDGKLNYGDISAVKLQAKKNIFSPDIQIKLSNKANWDTNILSKLIGINQDECFELFDLNGDNNIDEEDFNLYANLENNTTTFDIDADGKIDNQDVALVTNYFDAIMRRYDNKGEFLEHTKAIMGGEDRLNILKEYFEEKANEKILKSS